MSLLLDALKRAELAKRQQAAGVEPEVYPSLALQADEAAQNVASQGPPDVLSANGETAPESAFAAGLALALEPVERTADVSPATDPELSLPERVSAATTVPAAPMPFASEAAEPPVAITRAPESTEAAKPPSEPAHEPEGEPPVLLAAVAASPSALTGKPAPSSPLASRFGAAAKPAVEGPGPEIASAQAPGSAPVGSISPTAAVAATPEAAKRVMINKPARKPMNRAVLLALGGVLLLAASAGYVWWQMQPPSFNPDPALASDPLAASMADAGAAGNTAPVPAVVAAPATVAAASSTPTVGKVATATPNKPAAAVTPATENASAVNRPSKRLEIRHDAPEEAVDESVQAGYKAYQSGDLASARAAYVRALQTNPRERDALLGMAAIAARQGRPDEAERLYRKQLDYDPLDEVAKAGLTGISKGMGTREREAALRNLGDQPASSAQTAVQLGNLYASEKRWNEAQQQYFRALTLEPASPDNAFNLAISLEHLDQPRLALEYYQKAQTLAAQRKPGFDPAELKTRIEALSQP